MKKILLFLLLGLISLPSFAQEQLLNVAKQYLLAGNYEKAASTYRQLLDYSPNDRDLQASYLQCLMALKDYKTAEKVLKPLLKAKPQDPYLNFQLAKVYKEGGESKKSSKQINKILDHLGQSDEEIRQTATMFETDLFLDEAITTYEKGKSFYKENPFLYAEELALLYNKKGNADKALESLLDCYVSRPDKSEEIKATFQRMINEPAKLLDLQQRIQRRIEKNPTMEGYPDLMAWIYIQQNNYDKAFEVIEGIDRRLGEGGRRLIGFARVCFREARFSAAIKAYEAVIALGKEQPFYMTSRSEKLTCMKQQIQRNPTYTQQDVQKLSEQYTQFLQEYPVFKQRETLREYAELEARYAHNIDKAIQLLQEVVDAGPNVPANFRARCKLEMGDYELLRDNIWESTLLYAQVDKEFKQDMMGEEARFRNARLSYFTGDFAWAQGQLDVLKASTSELIANDALNLSVLITENNPPADSNSTPLEWFARAELLEFQHKHEEALALLDSINAQFPNHPLVDDILMQRAEISALRLDFGEAARLWQQIVNQHGEDILADDALFKLAMVNEQEFKNNDEAKRLFEQLILKYPGSSYVNEARKHFRRLRGDKAEVEDGSGI